MKIGAKYKMCRRLGVGVFEKCQTQKYTQSEMRKSQASNKRPKQLTDFGKQLIEKQKVRFSYGISERQLSNYVEKSSTAKGMNVSDKLYELLENRLDNVVYRLGFANTRRFARQLVSHGHFVINGVKTTIPSYEVKVGDKISVREGSRASKIFEGFSTKVKGLNPPKWLKLDPSSLSAEILSKPKNDEQFLQLETVLEFYSR